MSTSIQGQLKISKYFKQINIFSAIQSTTRNHFQPSKSSDTHYEQHLAQHIQQGKWFRCQSCRLVFETETSRNRHELEMHGRQKWTVPEAHPKVPTNVKGFYSSTKCFHDQVNLFRSRFSGSPLLIRYSG